MLRTMGRDGPSGHRAFSELIFGQDPTSAEVINEGDGEGEGVNIKEDDSRQLHTSHEPASGCGYLEDDDIEDW